MVNFYRPAPPGQAVAELLAVLLVSVLPVSVLLVSVLLPSVLFVSVFADSTSCVP
jgi:hypothetical protein